MTFDDMPAGQTVFLDANVFLYYFTAHPKYGTACQELPKGIAQRLRHHPAEVQQLVRSRQAVDEISLIGVDVLPVSKHHVSLAPDITRYAPV